MIFLISDALQHLLELRCGVPVAEEGPGVAAVAVEPDVVVVAVSGAVVVAPGAAEWVRCAVAAACGWAAAAEECYAVVAEPDVPAEHCAAAELRCVVAEVPGVPAERCVAAEPVDSDVVAVHCAAAEPDLFWPEAVVQLLQVRVQLLH